MLLGILEVPLVVALLIVDEPLPDELAVFGLASLLGVGAAYVVTQAIARPLRDLASVTVDGDLQSAVGHGKVLPAATLGVTGPGPWRVLDPGGALLAVYEAHKADGVKPSVVLAPA